LKETYPIPKWVTNYYEDFRLKERTKCFKTCLKCGETKLISKFSVDKRNLDGRISVCKACRSLEGLKYYYHNQSKRLIQGKEYRDNHKKNRSIYNEKYRIDHKEELKERASKWYQENKEAIKKRNLKYYQENLVACLARRELWRSKNKESIRKYNREYKRKGKGIKK
jgi:post-segregation antitoxin (ccd killing protein)